MQAVNSLRVWRKLKANQKKQHNCQVHGLAPPIHIKTCTGAGLEVDDNMGLWWPLALPIACLAAGRVVVYLRSLTLRVT